MMSGNLPLCPKCQGTGKLGSVLLPLSDFGPEGASIGIKVWACADDACGHTVRVDKGVVAYEKVGERALREDGPVVTRRRY
jgi:hypothetical protein